MIYEDIQSVVMDEQVLLKREFINLTRIKNNKGNLLYLQREIM